MTVGNRWLLILALVIFQADPVAAGGQVIPTPPQRIVSLAPSLTEILFAIGLDREIAGVTEFCDYPPEARKKPKVGGMMMNPNLESIVRMKPDRVLAVKGFNSPELLERLKRLDIPVSELEFRSLDDIFTGIMEIGRIAGRETAARDLVGRMKVRIQVLREKILHHPKRPRVFYVISMTPPMTVGPGSFIQEMIEKAGGENLMGDAPNPYPLFSLEEVLIRDPDVILFSSEIGIRYEELVRQWARWDRIKAVSTHRLYRMDADLIDRPGPRIVEGLEKMTGIFYDETVNP